MKRLGFFLLWALVFWLVIITMGRQYFVFSNPEIWRDEAEPKSAREGFNVGLRAGLNARQRGREFVREYWHISLACAFTLTALGTVTGVLPGARKIRIPEPPPLP